MWSPYASVLLHSTKSLIALARASRGVSNVNKSNRGQWGKHTGDIGGKGPCPPDAVSPRVCLSPHANRRISCFFEPATMLGAGSPVEVILWGSGGGAQWGDRSFSKDTDKLHMGREKTNPY